MTKRDMTDEEQRIQDLKRELHGLIKDARQATADLNTAMNRYGGSVTKHYRKVIAERDRELNAVVGDIRASLDEAEMHMQQQLATLLGAGNPDQLFHALTAAVAITLAPDVQDKVARAASRAASIRAFREIVTQELAKAVKQAPSVVVEKPGGERREGSGFVLDLAILTTDEPLSGLADLAKALRSPGNGGRK